MKRCLLFAITFILFSNLLAQTTYTWIGGASGTYGTPTNWSPARLTPATTDIIVFDLHNINGSSAQGNVTVSNVTNETIGQLQIIQSGSPSNSYMLAFSGTATTLTITGDLTMGQYSGTRLKYSCSFADGGTTINVGGNFICPCITSFIAHTGTGKIIFTGLTALFGASGSAPYPIIQFQNVEISSAANLTINSKVGALQINGNLNINGGGKLTLNSKILQLNSSSGVGGTISGSGVIVGDATAALIVQGTNGGSPQTVGTLNFDNSSAIKSTLSYLENNLINSTFTIGSAHNNTLNLTGDLDLFYGTVNDGGNTIAVAGNVNSSNFGIESGSGKIYITGNGKTITNVVLHNIEIAGGNISIQNSSISGLLKLTSGTLNTPAYVNPVVLNNTANIIISPNASFNVATGGAFNFNNRPVTVQSTAAGDGMIVNAGSILNASNVTVQRYLSQNQRAWRILSNPLTNSISWNVLAANSTTPIDLSGTGITASGEIYNPVNNVFEGYSSSANTIPGTSGYSLFVRGKSGEGIGADRTYSISGTPSNVTLAVTGTLNTGNVTMSVTAGNYYVIPNPFAAPVSAYAILNYGSNSTLINNSAIYYWNAVLGSTDVKVLSGGYVTPSLASSSTAGDAYDYIVPIMGAFLVSATGTGTITIPTSAMYAGTYTYKLPFGINTQNNHIGLSVLRDTIPFDYLNIYMNDNASALSTDKLDFEKMNNTNLDFYSISADNKNLSIDERAATTQKIALGIKTNLQNQFVIKVDALNLPAGTELYLKDNLLNTLTLLNEGLKYNFLITSDSLTKGNNRFELTYTKAGLPLMRGEIDNTAQNELTVYPNPAHDFVLVSTHSNAATDITIYDSRGGLINTQKNSGTNVIKIPVGNLSAGMYLFHITDGQQTIIKRVMIH